MTLSIWSSVRSLATRRSVLAGAATAGALRLAVDAFAGASITGVAPPARTARRMTLAGARMPIEGRFPSLAGATAWINSAPLTPAGLKGKTVLVEFWTHTCINWRRQFPYVRAWAEKYGMERLVVIGVHTPEFDFEHDPDNVRRAAKEIGVTFPVADDSGYAIWNAFNNEAWPALYFIDTQGRVRHRFYGEGDYDQSERIIQQLLSESGAKDVSHDLASVRADGAEAAADWPNLKSPESYLGYDQAENFASPGGALVGKPRDYAVPDRLQRNQWSLSGDWTVENQAALLNGSSGRIRYRFHARDLHLVLAPPAKDRAARFRITIDGATPDDALGVDASAGGQGTVDQPRLYQLIRQSGPILDRTFEIEFFDPGVRAYDFTFG
jgi:thiol-disulfide isomerase/thioredoxin